MKVSIQTLGSLGDVIPYVSLGLALKARGVDVSILAPSDFSDLIAEHAIEVSEPASFKLSEWMDEAAERSTLGNPLSFFRDWGRMIAPHIDEMMARCLEAGEGADLIVGNLICAPARVAAEAHGCPFILTAQQSVLSPTREEPCAMMWRSWHGKRFNRVGFSLVNLSNRIIGRSLARHRTRLGVGQQPQFSDLRTHLGKPLPKVTSVPWPVMSNLPADWSKANYLTTYPSLPEGSKAALSPAIKAFLQAGPPPVYVGLGSLSRAHGAALLRVAIEGLAAAGQRGIIASGLAKVSGETPASVLTVGHEPHDVLFPKCAAIVHHGGAGTSDTSLRAGVPQILQPHFLDQFWYADKLAQIGVAPEALPSRGLSVSRLAKALEAAGSAAVKARAVEVGRDARAKTGADDLADLILKLAESAPL